MIMRHGCLVPLPFLRLQTGPFNAESKSVEIEFFEQIKIFGVALVVIDAFARYVVLRSFGLLLYLRPQGQIGVTLVGRQSQLFGMRQLPDRPVTGNAALDLISRR